MIRPLKYLYRGGAGAPGGFGGVPCLGNDAQPVPTEANIAPNSTILINFFFITVNVFNVNSIAGLFVLNTFKLVAYPCGAPGGAGGGDTRRGGLQAISDAKIIPKNIMVIALFMPD